jgi:hypothetical protein
MDIATATLFVCCLLFSGFSFLVNMRSRHGWLKLLTLILGLVSLTGAAALLLNSFIHYIK